VKRGASAADALDVRRLGAELTDDRERARDAGLGATDKPVYECSPSDELAKPGTRSSGAKASVHRPATSDLEIRVLVAVDCTLVREGLCELIRLQSGLQVVGEAADGREAVSAAAALRPDVVVLDVWLPRLSGLLAIGGIRAALPKAGVVVLSALDRAHLVVDALRAGASAYVLKSAGCAELIAAIRAAGSGERYLTSALTEKVIAGVVEPSADRSQPLGLLTAREREILQRLAEGSSAKEISRELHISVRTVDTHRSTIMRKLGIRKIAGLVRLAIREGIMAP
jgi:two-component system, NarL family, response regulator NreC